VYHSIGYLLVMSSLVLHQGRKREWLKERLKVCKLREPNVKQEFARLVTYRKDEVFETDNVESKWSNERGMAEGNRTSMWVDKRTTKA